MVNPCSTAHSALQAVVSCWAARAWQIAIVATSPHAALRAPMLIELRSRGWWRRARQRLARLRIPGGTKLAPALYKRHVYKVGAVGIAEPLRTQSSGCDRRMLSCKTR